MKTIILFFSIIFCSCAAKTEFYRDGKKIAAFQGDMKNSSLTITDDTLRWSASSVDHSPATKAHGEAGRGRWEAINISAAAAALSALFQ